MTKEQIYEKINKIGKTLENPQLTEGAKANLRKMVVTLSQEVQELEKAEEKKEEKIEKKEEKEVENLDDVISKLEAQLKRNPPAAIRAVFEKKLKAAKEKRGDVVAEAKEDKKEAKEEIKEVKEAVKEIKKAVATGRTTPIKIKKPKAKEKREEKSEKRIKKIKKETDSLQSLVDRIKSLREKYQGRGVDLQRDSGRPAKPFGYRFKGKGANAYKKPTQREIIEGKRRGIIDYEGRANRSDKFPSGYKRTNIKLADGGMMAKVGDIKNQYKEASSRFSRNRSAKDIWGSLLDNQRSHFLKDHFGNTFKSAFVDFPTQNFVTKEWDELPNDIQFEFKKHIEMGEYADGGMMADGELMKIKDVQGIDIYESDSFNSVDVTINYPEPNKNISATLGRVFQDFDDAKRKFKKNSFTAERFAVGEITDGKVTKYDIEKVGTFKTRDEAKEALLNSNVDKKLLDNVMSTTKKLADGGMADGGMMAKGGPTAYNPKTKKIEVIKTYVLKDENGKQLLRTKSYNNIIDEHITKKFNGIKTDVFVIYKDGSERNISNKEQEPKVTRTQFEEESFEYAKGGKMSKGGQAKKSKKARKNSKNRFAWTKDAVKDGIIKASKLNSVPSNYQRKKYPAYIIEK